jgi:O-antigen ligase
VQITISTIYAIYLISRFPLERLAVMLSWVFVILTVGRFSFGLLLPQYGRDHFGNSGSWQGITAQKNTLGLVMAYGVAIALAMKPATFVHRCVRAGLLILCLGMVYLSQSREAWLVSAMLFMVHFFLKLVSRFARRSRRPVLLICFIGILLVAGVIATNWVEFLKLLGRDATLRGRTELWAAVLLECQNHLWRGHSGSPFWGTGAANRIYAVTGWLPTSAHNGFLECLLDYGIPALFFLGLLFLISIRNGIRLLYTSESYESRKLWIYLIFTISIFNMVQTTTGFPNSISWLFLVGSACVLERSVKAAVQPVARTRCAPTPMLTLTNPAS